MNNINGSGKKGGGVLSSEENRKFKKLKEGTRGLSFKRNKIT